MADLRKLKKNKEKETAAFRITKTTGDITVNTTIHCPGIVPLI